MKRAKPKKVSYEIIPRDSVIGESMYALLDQLVELHHEDVRFARIALAWCTSWNPDVDGRVTLGKCKRASDLDRELAAFDFIVLLRRSFWHDERVTDLQRQALLDHELCHTARKYDSNGEPVEDERGRRVYRTRKHDIEEFTAIVERYGCYKADLEQFAAALKRAEAPTLPLDVLDEAKVHDAMARLGDMGGCTLTGPDGESVAFNPATSKAHRETAKKLRRQAETH